MKLLRAPRIFRIFLIAMLLVALARMGRAEVPGTLAQAMAFLRHGDYANALPAAGREGSVARDIVEWHRLREGKGSFADYRAFLKRRPDWPGLPWLMKFGEASIDDTTDPNAVVAYFAIEPPQTGAGLLALTRADLALGMQGDAEATAVMGWRSMALSPAESDTLRQTFPKLLAKHDIARLDMALWRGMADEARRLLPRVPADWQALAAARIALRSDADGVDALVAKVPKSLADDPGLAWERYNWRKRKGLADSALALLLERSISAKSLGWPDRWSNDRRWLARDLMRAGRAETAYKVASRHFLQPADSDYPDLEWLSGYLALRYLHRPADALEHFTRFRMAVSTPISLGRAGYWEGRALEAMGAKPDAQAAYEFGAEFQTSFYGLLAAEKAGLPMDPALMGSDRYPDWRKGAFRQSSVYQAAMLLLDAGELDLAERFLRHLCESLDATQIGQLAEMAIDMDQPHLALSLAKFAADRGIVLNRAYYPLSDLARAKLPVPTELALAIARRESEFDPKVISHAGARGLMQLMPGTAQDMAKTVGVDYDRDRLTSDPAYNATLGSAYLARLIDEFGANWMLVAAGYNAGPTRPRRWLADFGDPRDPDVDPVDWIESIPFDETRNYIMRVTESIPVYRARLQGKVAPITLLADLKAR